MKPRVTIQPIYIVSCDECGVGWGDGEMMSREQAREFKREHLDAHKRGLEEGEPD